MNDKNKKDFPLVVHENLNELREEFAKYFCSANTEDPLLIFKDIDDNSDFFFQINNHSNLPIHYKITYKPTSGNNLATYSSVSPFKDVKALLKSWATTVEQFDKTVNFFRDSITSTYEEEFFEEYRLVEEDADYKPFDIKKQLLIDDYLNSALTFIDNFEKINPTIDLSESRKIAINLKENITNLPKNEVVKRLSRFWASARKKGLVIIKELFFELAKELVKELGKKMIGL